MTLATLLWTSGDATETGQTVLLVTFLVNIVVQVWREWLSRRDARLAKLEARREAEALATKTVQEATKVKAEMEAAHAKTRSELTDALDKLKKRFNGLLVEEDQ